MFGLRALPGCVGDYPGGDQFVLHLLFSDALFEGLQAFVVQCMFLESKTCQSHSVN
jgi:hypothetical protein